jgi:hypothetical protein
MVARVTLRKGKTYRVGGKLFRNGKTEQVNNSSLIELLQANPAFVVAVQAKVVRKIVKKKSAPKKVAKTGTVKKANGKKPTG